MIRFASSLQKHYCERVSTCLKHSAMHSRAATAFFGPKLLDGRRGLFKDKFLEWPMPRLPCLFTDEIFSWSNRLIWSISPWRCLSLAMNGFELFRNRKVEGSWNVLSPVISPPSLSDSAFRENDERRIPEQMLRLLIESDTQPRKEQNLTENWN